MKNKIFGFIFTWLIFNFKGWKIVLFFRKSFGRRNAEFFFRGIIGDVFDGINEALLNVMSDIGDVFRQRDFQII